MFVSLFLLNGCNSASIKARDHLYGYLESGGFYVDRYIQDDNLFTDMVYGGFSNYGYATEDYLELIYLREDVSAIIRYDYDYELLDSGLINLTVVAVNIDYKNIETHEYLRISQVDINDVYEFTEEEFDEFNVMLYELRLVDVLWVLDALGYELI